MLKNFDEISSLLSENGMRSINALREVMAIDGVKNKDFYDALISYVKGNKDLDPISLPEFE